MYNHGIELVLCFTNTLVFFLTYNLFFFFLHSIAVFFINLFAHIRFCCLLCFFYLLMHIPLWLFFNFNFMISLWLLHPFTLVNSLRTIKNHIIYSSCFLNRTSTILIAFSDQLHAISCLFCVIINLNISLDI